MGEPKALLETPSGVPLARHQHDLLVAAGCKSTAVVLGADAEAIESQLTPCRCVINSQWKRGRPTSVHAGIGTVEPFDGLFILPVDTVGIRLDTLLKMKDTAEERNPPAIRPMYNGEEGKVVWISKGVAEEVLKMDPSREDARLDVILRAVAEKLEIDDPALISNVNTPEDWERWRRLLRQ